MQNNSKYIGYFKMALTCALAFNIVACTNMQTRRAVTGAALGGAAGVGISAIAGGSLATGAIAGAATGAVVGGATSPDRNRDYYDDDDRYHHRRRGYNY